MHRKEGVFQQKCNHLCLKLIYDFRNEGLVILVRFEDLEDEETGPLLANS